MNLSILAKQTPVRQESYPASCNICSTLYLLKPASNSNSTKLLNFLLDRNCWAIYFRSVLGKRPSEAAIHFVSYIVGNKSSHQAVNSNKLGGNFEMNWLQMNSMSKNMLCPIIGFLYLIRDQITKENPSSYFKSISVSTLSCLTFSIIGSASVTHSYSCSVLVATKSSLVLLNESFHFCQPNLEQIWRARS